MSASPNVDPDFTRRLYGRRQGHALRQGQAALVEELLPKLAVPGGGPVPGERLVGDARPMQLESGFGAGETLAGQGAGHPKHCQNGLALRRVAACMLVCYPVEEIYKK